MAQVNQTFVVAVSLIAGWLCAGISTTASAEEAKEPEKAAKSEGQSTAGGATPEEAFEKFQHAVEKDDWKTAFRFQTESSRDYMLGGLVIACHLGALEEAGKKLVGESGDESKVKELVAKIMKAPQKEQSKFGGEIANLVAKKPEFMSRAISLFREQKKEAWVAHIGKVKLKKLKINADRASAQMELVLENGAGSEPMQFLQKDGRWFVDYSNE